jgi:hypothetical protein
MTTSQYRYQSMESTFLTMAHMYHMIISLSEYQCSEDLSVFTYFRRVIFQDLKIASYTCESVIDISH